MPIDQTLARAEEDTLAGRHALARQRLRGLVGSHPTRLDLRERLAEAYRREGDLAQAGRWSYLSEHREPREVAAFEGCYGDDPILIMKALGWRGSEEEATTDLARERLRAVRAQAEKKAGTPLTWERPRHPSRPTTWKDRVVDAVLLAVLLGLVLAVIVGVLSLAWQGVSVIAGWF